MNFFIDNNLPPRLARALNELSKPDHTVQHLRDRFPANTPDTKWIRILSEDIETDSVLVSGNWRITRHAHECKAWLDSGLTAFFLKKGWNNIKYWEQAAKLVKSWPDLIYQATHVEKGIGFFVPVRGATLTLVNPATL